MSCVWKLLWHGSVLSSQVRFPSLVNLQPQTNLKYHYPKRILNDLALLQVPNRARELLEITLVTSLITKGRKITQLPDKAANQRPQHGIAAF